MAEISRQMAADADDAGYSGTALSVVQVGLSSPH